MQKNYAINIDIVFFLITEEISFIPDNILNACEVIPISRPPKSLYNKFLKNKLSKNIQLENISNIKNLYASASITCEMQPPIHYKIICDKILENMIHVEEMNYLNFRDLLYDIFIYHLDITDCIWYILSELVEKNQIN